MDSELFLLVPETAASRKGLVPKITIVAATKIAVATNNIAIAISCIPPGYAFNLVVKRRNRFLSFIVIEYLLIVLY
jgi:hypothetical protein